MVRLTESKEVSSGIFWFTCEFLEDGKSDFYNSEMIYLNYPCDLDGNTDGVIIGNSKDGSSFTHKNTWQDLVRTKSKDIRNKPWNYFPRGRVEIHNGKAKIFYNPRLDECKNFRTEINIRFGLEVLTKIFVVDNSTHYGCYGDEISNPVFRRQQQQL